MVERLRKLRGERGERAKMDGTVFQPRLHERFPLDAAEVKPWLNALFPVKTPTDPMVVGALLLPEIAGSKFGAVLEKELTPLRNRVAHALFESGELELSSDDFLSHEAVVRFLPALKVMVRRMVKNEFPTEFAALLPDPPTRH